MSNDIIEYGNAAHVAGIGLDRHLNEKSTDNKIYDSNQENQSLHHKTTENNEGITSEQNDKTRGHFPQSPQAPQAPQAPREPWHCKNCEFETSSQDDYNKHNVLRHPRVAGYPDKNGRTS
jgi:hypothetical protein